MIDFHSHIIYNVDDGAETINDSTALIEMSKNNGIEKICATSHYVCGACEQNKEEYFAKLNELRELTGADIISGLEVRIRPEIVEKYEKGDIWCINNKKYMLLELPFEEIPKYTMDVIHELKVCGVKPVLAHPERNEEIKAKPAKLAEFIDEGVLMQVCRGSIFGRHGKRCAWVAKRMVKNNMVHLLGSDAHNINDRNTELKSAYDFVLKHNPELYKWICESESNIIEGKGVHFPEYINKWSIFFRGGGKKW